MLNKRHKYSYMSKKKERKNLFFAAAVFVLLCALFFLVNRFVIGMYWTESEAMSPALDAGDFVIVSPFYFLTQTGGEAETRRGDIVMLNPVYENSLRFPLNAADELVSFVTFQHFSPFRPKKAWGDKPVIRRLMGFPGDTLYMRDFVLYIKPAGTEHFLTEFELVPREKTYNIVTSPLPENWTDELPFSGSLPPRTLGENEFFALSDNRVAVNDSRIWDVLRSDDIKGHVVFRYWPLPKAGLL